MRKVVAGLYVSLDGVTESPEKWQFDHFDAEVMARLMAHSAAEDTVLLGRVTYQEWAGYWPTSTNEPYASHINNVPKYVVSTSMDETNWRNTTLINGSFREQIAALKAQPGKNIGVAGSPTLVRSLLQNNLLDELTLLILPVVVGRGRRLFENGSALQRLQRTDSQISATGVAILTYQPVAID